MPSFSSWIFLALVVAALLDAFGVAFAGEAAAALLALFIVLEVRAVAWPQLAIASVLIVAGLAAAVSQPEAAAIPAVAATLAKGLKAALPFLVLFAAVAWLTVPALESPSLRAARDTVASQPPGWRFATLAIAAHLLGSVFNLVAVSLLAILIGHQDRPPGRASADNHKPGGVSGAQSPDLAADAAVRKRLSRALLQGFATATAWSPLFVGTAVILAVLPEVRWISIAPYGVGLAALLLILAWSADRLFNPARAPLGAAAVPLPPGAAAPRNIDPAASVAPGRRFGRPMPPGAAWRLAGLVTALLVGVIGLVELTGFSIPIVLGLIGPPFAMLWRAKRRPQAAIENVADLARKVLRGLADLRTETLMFTAANTFSAGIAAAVPAAKAGEAVAALGLGPDGLIFALALGLICASALGIHPVIAVVLIGPVVPPETFGLPLPLLALLLMALWGMGTNVSPFSATNIIMSRAVGMNHWIIAWRWNLPFSLAGAGVVAAAVVGLRRLVAG